MFGCTEPALSLDDSRKAEHLIRL